MDARERGPTFVDKIPPMSTSTQVQIGSDFLGYRIEELIGQGGMGVVYRAYDLRLKRTVALKLIVPELALDERFHARFARETELAMSLEHPNVVPVYDAGDVDGRFYLAMRLVEGTDLGALLRAEGALDPARALAICSQVANALDAAHGKDLVHRDVKPSNVLLDTERARLSGRLRADPTVRGAGCPGRGRPVRWERPPTSHRSRSKGGRSTAERTSTRSAASFTSASPARPRFRRTRGWRLRGRTWRRSHRTRARTTPICLERSTL